MASEHPPVSPYAAGFTCRCPRCGKGKLFEGAMGLNVRERCENCGLDLKFVDPGDGPAVFAIMILGFLMLSAALFVEFRYEPRVWVHALVFAPLTLGVAIGLLRPLKGTLIALQYHNKAEEGRIAKD